MRQDIHPQDVLVLSDDIRHTSGFSTNGRHVCWALAERYDVANASPQASFPAEVEYRGRTIPIYPCPNSQTERGVNKDVGGKGMARLLNVCDPDVVISVVDAQMADYLVKLRNPLQATVQLRNPGENRPDMGQAVTNLQRAIQDTDWEPRFTWIAQVPFDGLDAPATWQSFFDEVDYTVAMSEYAQTTFAERYNLDEVFHIPHAVEFAERVDPEPEPGDTFVVGSVNRNQFRKRPIRLLRAWERFYERAGRPDDVEFYLHADPNDEMGWDLMRYVNQLSIREAWIPYKGQVEAPQLARLFAGMDVHTSATMGEGFGLTTVEAASQGTPTVITDCTTSPELIEGGEPSPRGYLAAVETDMVAHPNHGSMRRALVDIDDLANCILTYYENRDLAREHGENAAEWARERLSYDRIADEWLALVDRAMPGTEPTTTTTGATPTP